MTKANYSSMKNEKKVLKKPAKEINSIQDLRDKYESMKKNGRRSK